ncbi:MAG: hypothetical protein WCD35_02465 [Mycobacteriales bacterium]
MDKLKQWVALTVVGVLAVGAGGWFLVISPKRSEAADVRSRVEQEANANNSLQTQLVMLKAQQKNLPQQQAKLAAAAAKIPDNPSLPSLIRALSKAADDTGVELVSLSPGMPTAVAAAPGAAAVQPAGAAPAGAAAAPSGASASSIGSGAGTLQSISVTLNIAGGYFQAEQFFDRLENLSRAFKVTNFTMAPGGSPLKPAAGAASASNSLTVAINGSVYMASGRTSTVPTAVAAK